MTLNCHRFFLTQSMRDKLQLSNLARQAFPGKVDFILSAYENAMERRFGHLCLDFSPRCRSELRVTADWFSQPPAITCYLYKDVGGGSGKKMGSNSFTKLVLVPFHRYSKLTSNDCHCSTSQQKQPLSCSCRAQLNTLAYPLFQLSMLCYIELH